MIKFLKQEIKKNLWAFVILSAICTIYYLIVVTDMDMVYNSPTIGIMIRESRIRDLGTILTMLCLFVPVLTYSFKMNKRSVDAYYSLPLTKQKLYLAKTLSGLFLVLAPFTVAYWSGFIALALRSGNPYQMIYYLPAYFGFLALGILYYGFNSFVFTRANSVVDGVVFLVAYQLIGLLIAYYIDELFNIPYGYINSTMPWKGISSFGYLMDSLIRGSSQIDLQIYPIIYLAVVGVVAYLLLFLTLRYERGENAEQISNSYFGYRVLIPLFAALLLSTTFNGIDFPSICLIVIAQIVGVIVYQRKFLFNKKEWLRIAIGLVSGILLGIIA